MGVFISEFPAKLSFYLRYANLLSADRQCVVNRIEIISLENDYDSFEIRAKRLQILTITRGNAPIYLLCIFRHLFKVLR